MSLDEIVQRFQAHGFRCVWRRDHWRCQCPAHGGEGLKDLNLSLRVGDKGVILVKCHSHGCTVFDVAPAVGLTVSDFSPHEWRANGQQPPEPEQAWPYRDEQDRVLFQVVRLPGKQFRQRRPEGSGGWKWGLGEARRVLFGLPELLQTQPGDLVAIVEGEKDAVNVASLGLAATTNPMGAGKWRQEYTDWLKEHLTGRRFILLPDNDEPGRRHAIEVYESLKHAGLDVAVAELPDLPEKGDVSDWIRAGGTAEYLRQKIEPPPDPLDSLVYDGPALLAAEIPEPEWFVPGLVAKRVMTMLVGVGKLGKSVLAHQLCVAGACGGVWLDQRVPQINCLYVNWEDPLGLTRARAVQQFAPVELPASYRAMEPPWGTSFPQFLAWLTRYLPKHNIELVVIDPLGIAARWKDEKDNAETGITLRDIQEVAQRTGAAILVVHHTRKQGGDEGLEVRGGSAIFAGIQGFLSFRRTGPGEYQLDTKDKMPGEHGGDKSLVLTREPHTLTWHVTEHRTPQEQEKLVSLDEVLCNIRADPGVTRAELQETLEIPRTTLQRYLKPLVEDGTIIESARMRRESDPLGHRPPKGLFWNEKRG